MPLIQHAILLHIYLGTILDMNNFIEKGQVTIEQLEGWF